MFAQKRYLLWSMQDIPGILYLNSSGGDESFNLKFSKEITFHHHCGFINSQPQLVYNKVFHNLAVCVRLVKTRFTFPNPFQETDTFYQATSMILVEQLSCNSNSRSCMYEHMYRMRVSVAKF